MIIGDKVRIKQEICANNLRNPHFNKIATVLKVDSLNMIKIGIDDFPNCNYRDFHNQFWFDKEDLELVIQ